MPISEFRAQNFRCLEDVRLELDPRYNLIYGGNASGKTSVLEALAYLGRGKSFRGAPTPSLVRHGEQEFVLFGKLLRGSKAINVGVRNGKEGLEVKVDGAGNGGAAALAGALPLQVIDPDVHNLVSGGPEERRRFLDWIAFHVEHDFLAAWRRFRRTLKQRNAALRAGGRGLEAWNAEFIELGIIVDTARRSVLEVSLDSLEEQGLALLGADVRFEYRPGWASNTDLARALGESVERDLAL
ncbi:MAG: DNA replication/repair protein RecF, partial [Woeseiaceae bacterium]